MRAGHVVVESSPTLITPGAVGTLEQGGVPRTPDEVVVHATHTTTFELAPLWCGVCGVVCM